MRKRDFIVQDLISKIYQTQFKDGKLPNQRKLAEIYQVSRYTIQEAINTLSEIGIIKAVQGSGMYIREELQYNSLIFNSLTRTPYKRISSKLISISKNQATPEEEQIFQLKEPEEVWTFVRLRIVDYAIEQIEKSKMLVSMFPDLSQEVIEDSIQKYVQRSGYNISHYITSYTPMLVNQEESQLLMCKRGTPAMRISNRCVLDDGRIYEYSELTAIDYTCTYIIPFDKEGHQSRWEE